MSRRKSRRRASTEQMAAEKRRMDEELSLDEGASADEMSLDGLDPADPDDELAGGDWDLPPEEYEYHMLQSCFGEKIRVHSALSIPPFRLHTMISDPADDAYTALIKFGALGRSEVIFSELAKWRERWSGTT